MKRKSEPTFTVAMPKIESMGKGEIRFEKSRSTLKGRKPNFSLTIWLNGDPVVRLNMPPECSDPNRWFEDAIYNGINQVRDSLRRY